MANVNAPFGFRPIIRMGGSPFSVAEYGKAAADTHAIYSFDLVGHLTGGTPFPLPENSTFNLSRIQSGSVLTPGTSLWLGASLTYGAASVGTVHPVADQIDCIFLAQAGNGATSMTTAGAAGQNANVFQGVGSATTKQSAFVVDSATVNTTSSLDLRIRQIAMITSNAEGAYALLEVTINKHALSGSTTAT
jgi:hypothetical protein